MVKSSVPAGTVAAARGIAEKLQNGRSAPFSTADLETMAISKLKMFCIQFGRLPSGSLEKSDLKKALMPLAKVVPAPKKVLPSFTSEELQTMSISKLKSHCLLYGRCGVVRPP